MQQEYKPFIIKDCVLAAIATGVKAQTLGEFRDRLADIHPGSIFYHFWRGQLESTFGIKSFFNDFSYWAYYSLHDPILAERLELLNPVEFTDIEGLRKELIEIIEDRLDEHEIVPWAKHEEQFQFIRSKTVVFNTSLQINRPFDLVTVVPAMPKNSIFYHFIESRQRTLEEKDDFSTWIKQFGSDYIPLIERLSNIDPYFISLADLQTRLTFEFKDFFSNKEKGFS